MTQHKPHLMYQAKYTQIFSNCQTSSATSTPTHAHYALVTWFEVGVCTWTTALVTEGFGVGLDVVVVWADLAEKEGEYYHTAPDDHMA